MALAPYPDAIEIGAWPYQRGYVRRREELVVRFDGSLSFGDQTLHLVNLRYQPRVPEHDHRFEALHAADMRWIDAVDESRPDGIRGVARELAQAPPIVDAAPVYMPQDTDEWDAAIPLPGDLLIRIPEERLAEAIVGLDGLDLVHQPAVSALLGGEHRLFRLRGHRLRDDGFGFDEAVPRPLLAAVLEVSGVEGAEHDWLKLETFAMAFPADPPGDVYWEHQWNLQQIGMEAGWQATGGTAGDPVAVIDSGFDLNHEDLDFPANLRFDAEAKWLTGVDSQAAGPSGYPHGTAVAGLVGAKVDNGTVGVASVGSGCPIAAIRLGAVPSSGRVATALGWAHGGGRAIRVASMSLTVVETSAVISAVDAAWAADMVLCAAAGNMPPYLGARTVGFPARHVCVIGVGASDRQDDPPRRYRWRNYGEERWQGRYGPGVDVVAPGIRLWTTDESQEPQAGFNPASPDWPRGPNGEPLWSGGETDGYGGDPAYLAVFSGTSGATPQVAGLASLILAQRGTLSNEDVRNLIERTCDPAPGPLGDHPKRIGGPGWDSEVGCGRINVAAALADIASNPPLPMIPPNPDPCDLSERIPYEGFLGRGPGTQWRIYATRELDRWIEVQETDIVGADQIITGGWRVYLRPGAEIREVAVAYLKARSPMPAG